MGETREARLSQFSTTTSRRRPIANGLPVFQPMHIPNTQTGANGDDSRLGQVDMQRSAQQQKQRKIHTIFCVYCCKMEYSCSKALNVQLGGAQAIGCCSTGLAVNFGHYGSNSRKNVPKHQCRQMHRVLLKSSKLRQGIGLIY
jgi:hypothetical protein